MSKQLTQYWDYMTGREQKQFRATYTTLKTAEQLFIHEPSGELRRRIALLEAELERMERVAVIRSEELWSQ